jgi:hypothetical protein
VGEDETKEKRAETHVGIAALGCPASEARQNRSILSLILGGAAVHRCDKRLLSRVGFSRGVQTPTWKYFSRSLLIDDTKNESVRTR